ncbi:TPA: restriction endonuclease subunit S [Staphylococcus aureus]|nr:restriction endonuclease subunit S [Staphylococcus aureus]MCG5196218.1 restriction endonuclease subunit S [Staphylococcus aureus]OHW12351.1 restriction endonuclease subunit S [Staphylococcus aureus]WIZ31179.1 restriction endonuclease subunit S [Staphylococcus aureus]SCR40033.1 restriction-modification system, S subunit [Staphylococcus aureus]SCR40461.1 restriction-modification system, S subunit [Staphylococcus aureus]
MSNTQKKNVPELRFPGFEGEWEEKKLRELRNPNDKYSYTGGPFGSDLKKSDYTTEGIQIIQLQNIGDGYFYNRNRVFTSYEKAESLKSCNIFPGDIVIAKMADPIARAAIVPNNNGKYLMASDGIRLSVDTLNFNTKFILECINRKSFRKKVEDNSSGSTRMRIGLSTLGNLTIKTTTLNEQQRIAEFLSKLDRQIELEEQKLELLQQQKKGYMQKIFSQELRFKDENGNDYPDWEERMIKDVYEITRGLVLSKKLISKKPNDVNKYPVYSSQTTNNGLMGYYSNYLYKDSITWTTDGANAGSVSYRSGKFYCTNVCGVLINEKGNSNLCMSEMLNSIAFKHVSKVGNPKLMNNVMAMVKLNFPCIEEQLKIARLIEAVEKNIINQERKLDLLKQVKKGLLQKMFI